MYLYLITQQTCHQQPPMIKKKRLSTIHNSLKIIDNEEIYDFLMYKTHLKPLFNGTIGYIYQLKL